MKYLLPLLSLACLVGCRSADSSLERDSGLSVVSVNDFASLPEEITFGELQERVGEALPAEPYFLYRIRGSNRVAVVEMHDPQGSPESRVISIYLVAPDFGQRLGQLWPSINQKKQK